MTISAEIPVGNFTGTGMHGGRIFIRTDKALSELAEQVTPSVAGQADMRELEAPISEFAAYFGADAQALMKDRYCVLRPNAKNPYKQLYTAN